MNIKGHIFGKGQPVICIPVIENTTENIVKEIKMLAEKQVQMIEWRMDWYDKVEEPEFVKEVLKAVSPYLHQTVLLCTFRSKGQGGEKDINPEEYHKLNLLVADSGIADMVDFEFYEIDNQEERIKELREKGVYVVCSNHNFLETPKIEEMETQLKEMILAGGDFAKIAVMPNRKADVLHLMEAVADVKEAYPDSHLIAMSMGREGGISRLLGEWYGSDITFAVIGKASAPGQISEPFVKTVFGLLEECVN